MTTSGQAAPTNTDLAAVPYLRTSTDDKGQDPLRQLDVVNPWGARERVFLHPPVIDEGTSAWKVDPFDRPRFLEAIRRAQELNAGGIVVETVDRFTRVDAEEFVYAKKKLQKEFGLRLWFADVPLRDADSFASAVVNFVRAQASNEWIKAHAAKTRIGIQRAKAAGRRMGRPPKPLSPGELAYIVQARQEGLGFPTIAHEVNRRRGVHDIKTPEVAKKRGVSEALVRKALRVRQQNSNPAQNPPEVPA